MQPPIWSNKLKSLPLSALLASFATNTRVFGNTDPIGAVSVCSFYQGLVFLESLHATCTSEVHIPRSLASLFSSSTDIGFLVPPTIFSSHIKMMMARLLCVKAWKICRDIVCGYQTLIYYIYFMHLTKHNKLASAILERKNGI